MATKKETASATPTKFTKAELLGAAVFFNRKDALSVVIKDGEMLTVDEAKERLEKFMKGKVK